MSKIRDLITVLVLQSPLPRCLKDMSQKSADCCTFSQATIFQQRYNCYIYEKRTPYLRKLCLKSLRECCGYNFQLLSLLHWKGGIWQVHRALTSSLVIHRAGHIGKELQ